jgi:hypothetical protein
MSTKHTPGPWRLGKEWSTSHADINRKTLVNVLQGAHGGVVAELWAYSNDPGQVGEMRADARLIAAAPELLEALEDLLCNPNVRAAMSGLTGADRLERADAAVAKAKGETP